jgi:enamine deaminase RidA (YjgF/YER057c/UK114 family)
MSSRRRSFSVEYDIYETLSNGHKPSRTTISVKQNPLDALVASECIAELQ